MSPRSHRPDRTAEPLASSGLADTIARLRRALRRAARAADPGNTLAIAQFELLTCVADNPGIRPSRVARLLHVRPNTITTLVNALVSYDMISRAAASDDGRGVALTVTESGRHAVHTWQATNNAVLNLALATLTAAQRSALARAVPALSALAVAIDQMADSADNQSACGVPSNWGHHPGGSGSP